MAQGCLKCLKITMCVANLLCFMCGVAVLGFGVYMLVNNKMTALTPSLASLTSANTLLITGIVITCVSFLGFLGALKENRCLLLMFFLLLFCLMLLELTVACLLLLYDRQISDQIRDELMNGLTKTNSTDEHTSDWDLLQSKLGCCGVTNSSDWGKNVPDSCCENGCGNEPKYHKTGCLTALTNLFEENFLTTGISVIVLCIIEVLGMCFAMTLFCHISRTGLGYKL